MAEIKKERNCRICANCRRIYENNERPGYIVECIPPSYLGTQASRLIPAIVTDKECSIFRLSEKKLQQLLAKEKEEADA